MTDEELAAYDSLTCLDDEQWMDVKRELLTEVRRLRALIDAVEWNAGDDWDIGACPWCRAWSDIEPKKHEPTCPAFPTSA